jgi:hypothetical protein
MNKIPMTDENYGQTMYTTQDRRVKPRIDCEYQAFVEGLDCGGIRYRDQAKLVNLSAGGLFMYLTREIENGSRISVTVHLSKSLIDADAPKLATNGVVVRTEPQMNGMCGVAVKFQNYRFL